jgi:hypothetical protein
MEANVTTTSNQLPSELTDAYGASQDVTSRDLMIPKLLLAQGLSKSVSAGTARVGDLMNNVTGEIVADLKTPIILLPFHCEKKFTVSNKEGEKWVFKRTEPVTPANINTPYLVDQFTRYEYTLDFFCLKEGEAVPMVLSFKGSSEQSGKKLFTQMYVLNKANGLAPCAKWIEVLPTPKTNVKGTFMTLASKPIRNATIDEQMECVKWLQSVKQSKVKVSENGDEDAPAQAAF